jgi:putative endonuclease
MYFERWFYVYILTNRSKTLYTGVTGRLKQRVWEHKTGACDGFTKRYKINRLMYYETYKYVNNAIAREKQIKRWSKIKKIRLIVGMNPAWRDLSEEWYPELRKKIMHRSLDYALTSLRSIRSPLGMTNREIIVS